MMRHLHKIIARAAILATAVFVFFCSQVIAAPELSMEQAEVKGGDCTACHEQSKVLPDDHPDTKNMDWAECKSCHDNELNLTGSHHHMLSDVNCIKCHGKTDSPEALSMENCIECHNIAELIKKTEGPDNPHFSRHYGSELDCNLCHHQHEESEMYCNKCHKFKVRTP